MALVMRHVEAAVVAADAGPDVLHAVLQHLGDPGAVSQELPGHTHGVDASLRNGGRGRIGFHAPGTDHRDVHEPLDVGHILQVAVQRHVHGRMGPVPGIIGAVIGVEHIVARVLQVTRGLLALLHVTADLGVSLPGQRAIAEILDLGQHAVADGHRVISPAGGLDGLDDLHSEAVAVFKAAAVAVAAVVGVFHGKLIQQVAFVDCMDLHAVHARLLAQQRRLGEGRHDLLDLGHRHFGAGDPLRPAGGQRAGAGQLVVGVQDGFGQHPQHRVFVQRQHLVRNAPGPAHAGGELHEQLGAGGVDLLHIRFQFPEHLFVLVQPPPADGIPDGGDAGNDQAHVVARPLQKEGGGLLVEVVGFHPAEQRGAAHGAEHDAVLDLHIADLPGGKQRFVRLFHTIASFLCAGKRFIPPVYHCPRSGAIRRKRGRGTVFYSARENRNTAVGSS